MSGSISCGVTTPFSWVLVHTRFCLSPLRVYFPVLCKFWHLYGGVTVTSSRRLMPYRSLLHPEPLPLQSPLLTHTSTGDTQTEFCFSLVGVSGSWCTQGLFEPSDLLWWAWGLILNVISPLLPSCWGFSFALECGVFPQSRSSAAQLPLLNFLRWNLPRSRIFESYDRLMFNCF